MVPLELALPTPAFPGTPKPLEANRNVEPMSTNARPALLVPPGLSNLARRATVTSSDTNASASSLRKIIDGEKESSDDNTVFLRRGVQWVQLDLGQSAELFAVVLWHSFNSPKVFHCVIAQLSDDPAFSKGVKTFFNNDVENAARVGIGTDREYFETNQGRLFDLKGAKGRYLRFYSKGSTETALNEYTEIEAWGRFAQGK